MRKLIYILLIGVFIACSEEETLTPMEVKNWYVITPTENMDEVLRLDYDMTEIANIQTKITFNKVDVTNPESKAAMMPLLKLLNEKLLAWIDGVDVFIPAILIVQDMEKGTKPMYVYRGFGVLGFA